MDFFEHQEQARKKTHLLLFYFFLAVVGIIVSVYVLVLLILHFTDNGGETAGTSLPLWDPSLFALSAGGTGIAVFLASSFKTLQLSGGGSVVARELGGREIDLNTTDYHERRLLNLVEEMAIASGVPVPAVYVMDGEDSINAFAAGKTPSDAVIGVTRGCMTLLTRDELQGVIAHEFSHILNGDMRLNMRLMGWLFGILFLALIGEFLLRNSFRAGGGSNRKEGAGFALVMVVSGLGLMIIGAVGSFFARMIKASVSRQREFLADASAVQFTRNPDGIAGALMKIGGLSAGSKVSHPMAKDASHLFFGSALSSDLFATHPPLGERVKRLLPHWEGHFDEVSLRPISESDDRREAAENPPVSGFAMQRPSAPLPLNDRELVESFRTVHPEQVDLGQALHQSLPQHWIEACRSRSGAQCLVFGLLLAQDDTLRAHEVRLLQEATDTETARNSGRFFGELATVHSAVKIGLVDLCIPSLRKLTPDEYQRFHSVLHRLVASDERVDLFEFMLLQIVTRHLDTWFGKRKDTRVRHQSLAPLREEAGVVISTLAALSHSENPRTRDEAFRRAADQLRESTGVEIPRLPGEACGLDRIKKSLARLDQASPLLKKHFLEACSLGVIADEGLTSREAELIRAVADAIGCPIPPFVKTARPV